ncbi:MAG: lipocalin-like domain-containing protein [Gammaproteobacteria bacterium]|nr:lipocalin-like domain-containing protein [Gammaproteobacteria bacterium]
MRTSSPRPEARATRRRLRGAWQLLRIEYRAPDGDTVDPFYRPNSTGVLIYDAAGWMSVAIAGPGAYYTYAGTWDVDAAGTTVIHRVTTALLADEVGVAYRQRVHFESGRMIFTNREGPAGARTVRRKIWVRARRADR